MRIQILSVERAEGVFHVTLERGRGEEVFKVTSKDDLVKQLAQAMMCDSDYNSLKALEGTTLTL